MVNRIITNLETVKDQIWLGLCDTEHYSKEIRDNQEIMFQVIKCRGADAEYLSPRLKDNEAFIEQLIKDRSGFILQYASDRLRDDKEFITRMFEHSPHIYESMSKRLRSDEELIYKAVGVECMTLQIVPKDYKDREDLVLLAVKQDPRSIVYASDRLQSVCEGKDPAKVIESILLSEQLKKDLTQKSTSEKSKKLKL